MMAGNRATYEPTAADIENACRTIQATWDKRIEAARRDHDTESRMTCPRSRFGDSVREPRE
jgi:hypothetical protein